jgi:uncharacterized membrane protein YozB (DUF420 family)
VEGVRTGYLGQLRTLVVLLLTLQCVSVVLAWSLNPVSQRSQTAYALLLAADLVGFSLVSYISRVGNRGETVRGAFVLAGSAAVLFFMFLVSLV